MSQLPPPLGAQELLAALPAFVLELTPEGTILQVNRLAPGFTMEQVRGASVLDFLDPSSHDQVRRCLECVVATGEPGSYASVGASAHGKPTHYFTIVSPVLEERRVARLVLVATDVSPVAEAQRALAESETKLRLALEASGMGTWSYDPATQLGTMDAIARRIFGISSGAGDLPPSDVMGRVPEEERELIEGALRRAFETGVYGPLEHRVIRPDGSVRIVSSTGRVHRVGEADQGRLVGGVVDVTDRRAQEERLAQAQKLDSIGRLAGGIAHDFNNMLTAILSYAELGLRAAPPGSALAGDLEEIRHAADRSRALTSRLLAFARRQRAEPRAVDPSTLVADLDRLLGRILGEDIRIVTSLGARRTLHADPHQIEQLLLNLATNARDAMPGGGELRLDTTDVELDADEASQLGVAPGPYVRFRVADTGEGIAPEHLSQVFEPFFTTKRVGEGTGLGLSQCLGIASQHGGALRISSERGKGTVVTLDLPARDGPVSVVAPKEAAPAAGHETILLVEDEPLVRGLAARLLEDAGHEVLIAADGEEAIAVSDRFPRKIHVLLTDMVMPLVTGVALAERIAERRPDIATIVMSGYSDDLVRGAGGKALRFLPKPFTPDELLASVREAVGGARVAPPAGAASG